MRRPRPVLASIVGTVAIASGVILTAQNWVLAAQNAVGDESVGSVTSLVQLGFVIGGAVALVTYGAVLHAAVAGFRAAGSSEQGAWTPAMGITFGIAALVVLPVLAVVWRMPSQRLSTRIGART